MICHDTPVVCVVPGDLHLTEAGLENHRAAVWMAGEVNDLIRPDFVQFIGDNVQNGTEEQFLLFTDLASRLHVPWYALVGDHDVENDPEAGNFRVHVGEPTGSLGLPGFRFLRLNTQEIRPTGMSAKQVIWFRAQVAVAREFGERVVLFQHNYPYKVWETFDGPGLDVWREVVQTQRIAAIITGHTHYGQTANDGRNVAITARSIGDPEGGPPGYLLVYLCGEDLAVTYRTVVDRGPVVLITHPRERLLATCPDHVVRGADRGCVRVWSVGAVAEVQGRLDDGPWIRLEPSGDQDWSCPLPCDRLPKGVHRFRARAVDRRGDWGQQTLEFAVDPTGRYTAVPRVRPEVHGTAFC